MARNRLSIRDVFSRQKTWICCAGAATIVVTAILAHYAWGPQSADAKATKAKGKRSAKQSQADAPPAALTRTGPEIPDPVARVDGQPIGKDELGEACLKAYGADVLDSLMHKQVIVYECEQLGISVTQAEIDAEIARVAANMTLGVEQFLKLLEEQRGIDPEQYARDLIWPTVALRKLSANEIEITKEDIEKAYDSLYGPTVRCRMIACATEQIAHDVRAEALSQPEEFHNLAKEHSIDPTASIGGLLQPIHRSQEGFEVAVLAFDLQDGEISEVFPLADQFAFVKRESETPGKKVPLASVRQTLVDGIRDGKLREMTTARFQKMTEQAQLVNVLASPELRAKHPGVAAFVHDQPLTIEALQEECIRRHGEEVLAGVVNRLLLRQACEKASVEVTPDDLQAELERAAVALGFATPDNRPDVAAYLKDAIENEKISEEDYLQEVVWATVALKKLVGGTVEVGEEDILKGYEANYGPRVRCRAIVCNNIGRAQELWEEARENQTVDHFGGLAQMHSVDRQSAALQGEIPPIQRHSGEERLEEQAFKLSKRHPLSDIIQLGDKYVILFYEGRTKPIVENIDDVRGRIEADLHEKLLRVKMRLKYAELQEANIVNHLTKTSTAPKTRQLPPPPDAGAARNKGRASR